MSQLMKITIAEYFEPEQVHIGNGQGLLIKHVGKSKFSSPYCSKILNLK